MSKGMAIASSVLTGAVLELSIQAMSGRREAWDSNQYWTIGLPLVALAAFAIGWLAEDKAWRWTILIVPSQVATMMVRSGELGGLWPLAVILSGVLSAPFVAAAFVASRCRQT